MTVQDEVIVFSTIFSPYAQRVLVALKEKEIPFKNVDVDFTNKPKELLEANPIHQKVPTIVHNGKPVAESKVIIQYLEDVWPNQVPLLPEGAYEKSQMRFWGDYVYEFFAQMFPNFFAKPGSPERAGADGITAAGLKTLEEAMLAFSAEGPFFAGDTFGYVDVLISPLMIWIPAQEKICGLTVPGPDKLPRVHKLLEAIRNHPSVKAVLPTVEAGVAIFDGAMAQRAAVYAPESLVSED